jgi:arsenate reductase (thioredoxin)
VQRAVWRLAPGAEVVRVTVDAAEKATALGFLGSPSIQVNGRDIEGKHTSAGARCCRRYEGGAGMPPEWLVEAAIVRALQPRGILFLCVANSARSQMAEGIARSLAPPGVTICSAGSRPTRLRDEAVVALREIGIDISSQHSKGFAAIPASAIDTVITLCGEEECPVFPGNVRRLHWGLPDPAGASASGAERLAAFRHVRDELRRRMEALLLEDH